MLLPYGHGVGIPCYCDCQRIGFSLIRGSVQFWKHFWLLNWIKKTQVGTKIILSLLLGGLGKGDYWTLMCVREPLLEWNFNVATIRVVKKFHFTKFILRISLLTPHFSPVVFSHYRLLINTTIHKNFARLVFLITRVVIKGGYSGLT